jgi:hypothetical protein
VRLSLFAYFANKDQRREILPLFISRVAFFYPSLRLIYFFLRVLIVISGADYDSFLSIGRKGLMRFVFLFIHRIFKHSPRGKSERP